jgi:hypothetical protein
VKKKLVRNLNRLVLSMTNLQIMILEEIDGSKTVTIRRRNLSRWSGSMSTRSLLHAQVERIQDYSVLRWKSIHQSELGDRSFETIYRIK